jgi:hypothetical protein
MNSLRLTLSLVLLSALVGCAAETAPPPEDEEMGTESPEMIARLAKKFGGEHSELALTATGGNLDLDCASGSLSAPLKVDAKGRFSVKGTFIRHTGARPMPGHEPQLESVQFKGQVTGTEMTLRFTTAAGAESFKLKANQPGVLFRCM